MVKVKEDLTGRRFEKLIVIEQVEDYVSPQKIHYSQWRCKCDCGNEVIAETSKLHSGRIKSCGCYNKPKNNKVNCKSDLTGTRFEKLLVIKRVEDRIGVSGRRTPFWECLCDCGNHTFVSSYNLKKGQVKSCGCYRSEWAKQNSSVIKYRNNIYEFYENYSICYTEDKKFKWLFDKEDYEIIKPYYWTTSESKTGYAEAKDPSIGRNIQMSRLIMGLKYGDKKEVDHINHDVHDNRKQNLRICTRSENNWNIGTRSNNKSGVTGVSWDKKSNKWVVHISYNGKDHNLGAYFDFNEAVKIRKEAEEKYFGEYSYDNSMKKAGEV